MASLELNMLLQSWQTHRGLSLPVRRAFQLCRHLKVVFFRILLQSCRGYREVSEQLNQPREASDAAECRGTKGGLERSALKPEHMSINRCFLYHQVQLASAPLLHTDDVEAVLPPVKCRVPSWRTLPSSSLCSALNSSESSSMCSSWRTTPDTHKHKRQDSGDRC